MTACLWQPAPRHPRLPDAGRGGGVQVRPVVCRVWGVWDVPCVQHLLCTAWVCVHWCAVWNECGCGPLCPVCVMCERVYPACDCALLCRLWVRHVV